MRKVGMGANKNSVDLAAENAELKKENADLAAENAELKKENADLAAENAKQKKALKKSEQKNKADTGEQNGAEVADTGEKNSPESGVPTGE